MTGPADGRSAVTEDDGIAYLHHTLDGTTLTGEGEAVWRFTWTAPDPAATRIAAISSAARPHSAAAARRRRSSEPARVAVEVGAFMPLPRPSARRASIGFGRDLGAGAEVRVQFGCERLNGLCDARTEAQQQ